MEYKISFNPDLCIECYACEGACKNWRHTEPGIKYRRIAVIESGVYPNMKTKYKNIACMQCNHAKCIDACPTMAISKNADGVVIVDRYRCVGCKACKDACPFDVPQFGADGTMQKCDMCYGITPEELRCPCVRMCPTKALSIKVQG